MNENKRPPFYERIGYKIIQFYCYIYHYHLVIKKIDNGNDFTTYYLDSNNGAFVWTSNPYNAKKLSSLTCKIYATIFTRKAHLKNISYDIIDCNQAFFNYDNSNYSNK